MKSEKGFVEEDGAYNRCSDLQSELEVSEAIKENSQRLELTYVYKLCNSNGNTYSSQIFPLASGHDFY